MSAPRRLTPGAAGKIPGPSIRILGRLSDGEAASRKTTSEIPCPKTVPTHGRINHRVNFARPQLPRLGAQPGAGAPFNREAARDKRDVHSEFRSQKDAHEAGSREPLRPARASV
jgi:hypothetical protein